MNIVDVRYKIATHKTRKFSRRSLSDINGVTVHHSAGESGGSASFASHHVNTKGWAGIGYHYVVLKNGTIEYCGSDGTIRAHNPATNANHLGVCLVGNMSNHEPTGQQLQAMREILQWLFTKRPDLPSLTGFNQVIGHRDSKATACPGDTWSKWKTKIKPGSTGTTTPPTSTGDNTMALLTYFADNKLGEHVLEARKNVNQLRRITSSEIKKSGYDFAKSNVFLTKTYKFKGDKTLYESGGKKVPNEKKFFKDHPWQEGGIVEVNPDIIKSPLERKARDLENEKNQLKAERDEARDQKNDLDKKLNVEFAKKQALENEVLKLKQKLSGTTTIDPETAEKAGLMDSLKRFYEWITGGKK